MSNKPSPKSEVLLEQLFHPVNIVQDNEKFVKSVMKGIRFRAWTRSLLLLAATLLGAAILSIQMLSLSVPLTLIYSEQISKFSSMQFLYILVAILLCFILPSITNSLARDF